MKFRWRSLAAITGILVVSVAVKAAHPWRFLQHYLTPSLTVTQAALWRYQEEATKQAALSRQSNSEITLLGDSLIASFPASQVPPGAANFGIAGDTIDGLLLRLPSYRLSNTNMIIVEIGINNWAKDGFADFGGKYRHLLAMLPSAASIVATSLPPTSEESSRYYFDFQAPRTAIATANREIRGACEEAPNCRFLDLLTALSDNDSNLQTQYDRGDGVHLSPAAYAVWAKMLFHRDL